jgi:hypothetical protein
MSKGFGFQQPKKISQKDILLKKLINQMELMPSVFRRNFAAAILENDTDSLTIYMEQLFAEAGIDAFKASLMVYHNRKLEKTIEKQFEKLLAPELKDMQ